MGQQFRREQVRPIASGVNTAQNPLLLANGEASQLVNYDLDRGALSTTNGSSKFNNQTCPRPGLLVGTRVPGGALPILPQKSAPVVSELFIPYDETQDIGADYVEDLKAGTNAPQNRFFGRLRGKTFERQLSFRLPEDTKLYGANHRGQLNNPGASYVMKFGADEALDEFIALEQKGGDRMTPMSWAIGLVNTGGLFDIDVGGGLNIFGLSTATHAKRVSNYALCFMWLDVPCYGVARPVCARYRLSAGSVWHDVDAAGVEAGHLTNVDGEYPTFAYRAMIVPFFVEPGRDYHVALRLALDSGTSGTAFTAATGQLAGVSWNNDGSIEWKVCADYDAVQTFTSANGASGQVLRYKGPDDTLEYFCKYGIRFSGRDATHVGLGYRFSPWQSGGFIPFGVDAAPLEHGGFQITDHSVHGPFLGMYQEVTNPELEYGAANPNYIDAQLRLEYDPAVDAGGTKFGVVYRGLVHFPGAPGHTWGNETLKWPNVDPVSGKNPWTPYDLAWAGLGGVLTTGFNAQALKSYRMVLVQDDAGWAANGACGGLISIDSYSAAAFGAYTFGQHITAEGGDQFLGANPVLAPLVRRWRFVVRAFRWNQRPVVVSDIRIYKKLRTWNAIADFSLRHELDPKLTGDPGLTDLVGHWPLTDGAGYECKETILGNSGFFMPMAGQRAVRGGIFLSGEGEALVCKLADNPDFREQLRVAQSDPRCGLALQLSFIVPEAQYALTQRVNDATGAGGASSLWRAKFAPVFAVLDFETPDRASDLVDPAVLANPWGASFSANQIDHVGGNFARPQPLFEFGHNVFVENAVGAEPFAWPVGFSMRAPTNSASDYKTAGLSVPGAGATGLHAWFNAAGNQSRWDKLARWVGKEIVMQIGFQPTGTDDTFIPYIAFWPKEFLNPTANDPSGAEAAYFASATLITRRQLERAVLVVGGAWNPRSDNVRGGAPAQWLTLGRAAHETSARMIVKDIRLSATALPGALPAASGSVLAQGTGKIIGENALPLRALAQEDLSIAVASGGAPLNFKKDSRTVSIQGGNISSALAEVSKFAVIRTFLALLGDVATIPVEGTESEEWPRTYFIKSAGPNTLTLSRPFPGANQLASAAKSFRLVAYTSFADDIFLPLSIGKGRGYDIAHVTVQDCQVSASAFENLSPVSSPWRWRIYSAIPSGSSLAMLPAWVRGVKCSTWNNVRGLWPVNQALYAAAQGSLFEADDRWRDFGPTETLRKAFALRAKAAHPRYPMERDRVDFADTTNVRLGGTWAVDAGVGYLAVIDAWVNPDTIDSVQTIAWCGRLDSNPLLSAGAHGLAWWLRLNDGYPELVLGSTALSGGVNPPRGQFIARGARRLVAGEWTHVRFALAGVSASSTLVAPVLWVGGKRVTTTRNAQDDAAAAGSWITQASLQEGATFHLVLGAARDGDASQVVTQAFAASADASKAPILPPNRHGYMHCFGGLLSGVVCARELNAGSFSTSSDFDPLAIAYSARRFAVLETSQSSYGVGHKMLDAALAQFGTINSHPAISIAHSMGEDAPWSFADVEGDLFCANGGRVGIIDTKTNEFRRAGIEGPRSLPKVDVIREPLWKANRFVALGDPDNDPIFSLEADKAALVPTTTTPAVVNLCHHYNHPGTKRLMHASSASMDWGPDKFFAVKGFVKLRSISGRISLWGRRDSLSSGTFLEVRDGYLYAGWWDTQLKEEVWVRTSSSVIEPGYWYYIHYRKWWPRGGLEAGHSALGTKAGSNWSNSMHRGGAAGENQACYDALIFRKVSRALQSGFYDYTGYDLKSYDRDTQAIYGGGNNYDYPGNGSSARMCVSATMADSEFTFDPYTTPMSPTGIVMLPQTVNAGTPGDANGRVQIAAASTQKFLLDHVGMLLQVNGGTLTGQVYRIVEFISAVSVRAIATDGTNAPFNVLAAGNSVSVFMGVSLVKSPNYDSSRSPDKGTYDIEAFGSALQTNPLNGLAPFDGEYASYAWRMFTAAVADGGGNLVGIPDLFEDLTLVNCPSPAAAGNRVSCACEAGTEVFGLQGSANTVIGELPFQGNPLGELQVDNNMAELAVDTHNYYDVLIPYVPVAAAPTSTKPPSSGATMTVARDAASLAGSDPLIEDLAPVVLGRRYAMVLFYDPARDRLSAPGERFSVNVAEDPNNPGASIRLVFSALPRCPDGDNFSTIIALTPVNSTVLFKRVQVDDGQPDAVEVAIDQVNETLLDPIDETALGVPPDASYVVATQARVVYLKIAGQVDGVAFSLPYIPESVPLENIFPANTGLSGITGAVDFKGALVVFKRDAVLPYRFDEASGFPILQKSGRADGCVSHSSIAVLEDRVYYMSDRGPQVLLDGWAPFFVGRRIQDYFKTSIDRTSLERISGAINRRRNQYVVTVKSLARSRMDERIALEFQHPSAGEDFERAEMAGGHRASFYQGPNCTALASVEPRGGGPSRLVGGTEHGFIAWLDDPTHRMVLSGPVITAAGVPLFGDRTLTKGAAALAGSFDRTLEGPLGLVLRAYKDGEHEAYVLFGANDGSDRLYLDRPLQEAMAWLNSFGAAQGDIVSLGAMLPVWSTKAFDCDTPDLWKVWYFLDLSRRPTSGTLRLDCYRNLELAPCAVGQVVDLALAFTEENIHNLLKDARVARFVLRAQTPAVDLDAEFTDLVLRLQDWDPR